jgi:hypothetical protein
VFLPLHPRSSHGSRFVLEIFRFTEYEPKKIKMAITAPGNKEEQVAKNAATIIRLKELSKKS